MASLKTLGIAIGAGLASALLFAVSAKGGALALVIACVTPLPIMIAALGFAQSTGLIAAAVASVVAGVLLGPLAGGIFGILIGFPAWWLCYLSLLARPVPASAAAPAPAAAQLAWYPIGRVVAWSALLTASVLLAFGAATLLHYGGYETALSTLAGEMRTALATTDSERSFADQAGIVVRMMPPLIAGLTFLILTVNLWLAARVVQGSGLLSRPWPPLPEHLRLPRAAAFVLVAAGLIAFLGGVTGVACGVIVAPLSLAFVLQGLSTAHALTRGLAARRLILLAIYFITLSLVPSLLALVVLGVVDCLTPLRRPRVVPPSPSN